jgi:hypothetical protein
VGGARDERPAAFVRYWTAAALSSFGTAITTVAMPVLVVQLLGATPLEVGVVNAAQFVPTPCSASSPVCTRIAGVAAPPRASIGRALSLGAVPVLWACGILQVWMLVVALLLFGSFSVFGFAAAQSSCPSRAA